MGLRVERQTKKLPFHQFVEKVYYHAVTTHRDKGGLHPLFFIDPLKFLITKHRLVKPEPKCDNNDSTDNVEIKIYKEEIKQFMHRKLNLHRNIEILYSLIWG